MMEKSSINEKVIQAAMPFLEGKTVKDLVVGISLIACQLSDGSVGVSYVLRQGLPSQCSVFGYAMEAIGRPAAEIAQWLISGEENLKRSIGSSVLAAASRGQDIPDDRDRTRMFGLDFVPEDTVGMIGYITPVVKMLNNKVKKIIVFDEGASASGETLQVCPMERQRELLPQCTKMIITGTSTVNGTIDGLLELCSSAAQIAIVGASTPMFPAAFAGTAVTSLAGSWWDNSRKEEIFKIISCGGGIGHLQGYMIKKAASVSGFA